MTEQIELHEEQALRSDPKLVKKLKKLGAIGIESCFNCGTCTATCPLSTGSTSFPRKLITFAQLGLASKILESPDPWLCYYCGECSKTCPRQAEPAETMMAMRRYAISKYNPTSIPQRIYESLWFALLFMGLTALLPIAMILGLHGPIDLQSVRMFTLIPETWIHNIGLVLGGVVFLAVVYGVAREYNYIFRGLTRKEETLDGETKPTDRGLIRWLKELVNTVVVEGLEQKRFTKCESSGKKTLKGWMQTRWAAHVAVVWGFIGLLISTTLRFVAFPTHGDLVPITDPIRLLGTLSGLLLVYGSSVMIFNRLNRKEVSSKYTHFTDWIFLGLLFLSGLSGFVLEAFDYTNAAFPVYIALVIHLVVVFELLLMAPFSKFSHAIYRPVAIWISLARRHI